MATTPAPVSVHLIAATAIHLGHFLDFANQHPRNPEGCRFSAELSGTKYRIVHDWSYGARSVHCFVDMETGEMYKAASWAKPAPGVRYNLFDKASRERLYDLFIWTGAHLYYDQVKQ